VLTVFGYFLILYGNVYYEAAERANEPTWFYQALAFTGFLLTWPITIYGWLKSYISDNNILGFEVWFLQFGGYALLYFLYAKLRNIKT